MDIDPRGPRFGALITMVVFVLVLITSSVWLLAAQAVVFAIGPCFGMREVPVRAAVPLAGRPRLGPPRRTRVRGAAAVRPGRGPGDQRRSGSSATPRASTPLGMAAAAAGLLAAFLNGVFGLCLGCEMYLLIRRIWPGRQAGAGRS